MREKDLKPGDAAAMAEAFAIFHAAMVLSDVGADMPFDGHKKRAVRSVFRQAGLYNGSSLTARGRRCQQLAIDHYERKRKKRKRS